MFVSIGLAFAFSARLRAPAALREWATEQAFCAGDGVFETNQELALEAADSDPCLEDECKSMRDALKRREAAALPARVRSGLAHARLASAKALLDLPELMDTLHQLSDCRQLKATVAGRQGYLTLESELEQAWTAAVEAEAVATALEAAAGETVAALQAAREQAALDLERARSGRRVSELLTETAPQVEGSRAVEPDAASAAEDWSGPAARGLSAEVTSTCIDAPDWFEVYTRRQTPAFSSSAEIARTRAAAKTARADA